MHQITIFILLGTRRSVLDGSVFINNPSIWVWLLPALFSNRVKVGAGVKMGRAKHVGYNNVLQDRAQ
jgi:hypothetical protein